MYNFAFIIYLSILFDSLSTTTVKWLPNSSFKIAENFKDGKLPCSKQTVVFPEMIAGSVEIATSEVAGYILPQDGELILDGDISFGGDSQDPDCKEGYSYYVDKTSSSWNQADVWSSPKFNDATPDSHKIPCFNDDVEFPENAKTTVALPEQSQYIKSIKIRGIDIKRSLYFSVYVRTLSDESQQFELNNRYQTGIHINEAMPCTQFGCPCQVMPMQIDCSVKFCPKPACTDPVKPIGFCCEICGGYVVFDLNDAFDMLAFNELVDNIIDSYGNDSVVYHIGFVPEVPVKRVQLVIVDKGTCKGTSPEVVNSISYAIHDRWFKGEKVAQISGGPLYKSGLSGKIFISVFFAVVLFMGALYVYYYKLPDVRYPVLARNGARNVFSRFQRRTDSVVSLTGNSGLRASIRSATAFRNPMYDSVRGRVHVAEPVVEE